MPTTEDRVPITLSLPREMIDQVGTLAQRNELTLEGELESLVQNGLKAESSVREQLERLSEVYRERLQREGTADQSYDEVMQELAKVREQVANELYPD